MDLNMCQLTQDLLPLYADDLLSPETRQALEVHARSCSSCAEALAGVATPLPPAVDAVEVEADGEPPQHWLHRLRRALFYGGGVLILLVVLVGTVGYQMAGRSGRGLPPDVPMQVASSFDLARKAVPGWERAAAEGLLVDLNQTLAIPDTNATITLEQAWYGEELSYVLYTVRAPQGEHLAITSATLDALPAMVHPWGHLAGGFSAEGYHQILYLQSFHRYEEGSELALRISRWGRITPKTRWYTAEQDTLAQIVTTRLPVPEGIFTDRFERYALDQSASWLGRSLTLEELAVGLRQVELTVLISLREGEIDPKLGATLLFEGVERPLRLSRSEETEVPGRYRLIYKADPPDRWPADAALAIAGIAFARQEPLLMELPWSQALRATEQADLRAGERPTARFYDSALEMVGTYESGRGFRFDLLLLDGPQPYVYLQPSRGQLTLKAPNGQVVDSFGSGVGPRERRRDFWSFYFDEVDAARMGQAEALQMRIEQPVGFMHLEEQWPLQLTLMQ